MKYAKASALSSLAMFLFGAAHAAEPTAKACVASEHRQFDFWIGAWEVFSPDGKKLGDSHIDRILDGCGLLENWTSTSGVAGKSLNMYDAEDKRWHQYWIDTGASRLLLDGEFSNGKMILANSVPDPKVKGNTIVQRITWSQHADGSVRQLWETSNDGGKSWTVAFDGKYVRKKKP